MNSKEIRERFGEVNKNNNILCTETELQEFLYSGLLFKTGKTYVSRDRQPIKIKLIKEKKYDFDYDFNNLITICESKCKEANIKRIYCMSQSCYNKYKEQGLIINKESRDYYRFFENELWLVYLIENEVEVNG